jgi:hypothetical protein
MILRHESRSTEVHIGRRTLDTMPQTDQKLYGWFAEDEDTKQEPLTALLVFLVDG